MKIRSLTPVIATRKLSESRDFYTQHLGFKPIFENDWYVQLRSTGDNPVDVAFVLPEHETQPPLFKPQFCGSGTIYTIEVENADVQYDRLRRADVPIAHDLCNEPGGERHFAIVDPNGIPINISQMIKPAKEYLPFFRQQ
jgi:catechol 2,3-dioxygenase-like lactoylglutathione lyase family enzyme